MDLSAEDSLRLNVMLANASAVRIDEGSMTVYCLSKTDEEGRIKLNPNCRSDQYVRRVKELLSSHVLGSPGGYPVFLKRWTRMGQTSDAKLYELLMLGESEAVVAVAVAPALTNDLARLAWWCMPDSANARCMLSRECVATDSMGPKLAEFLLEFLPFEEEPRDIIDSVRLVLRPGLIDEEDVMPIWQRGKSKSVFRIGFLQAIPDALPEQQQQRADCEEHEAALQELAGKGNPYAAQLLRLLSGPGQTYVKTAEAIMKKPANQDAVVALFDTIADYFAPVREDKNEFEMVEDIIAMVDGAVPADESMAAAYHELVDTIPALEAECRAIRIFSHIGEPQLRPVFARTDAIGSVMRKKIAHITTPLMEQFAVLKGQAQGKAR